MKLSEFKNNLNTISNLNFINLNGSSVPSHFHITEAGLTTKHFIDCGGTVRTEKTVSLQLWVANDLNHKLDPQKLKKIIAISENLIGNQDLDVEIEYQTETISRFGLDFNGSDFLFTGKSTNCLAKDSCGTNTKKEKVKLSELQKPESTCCTPGGGCC